MKDILIEEITTLWDMYISQRPVISSPANFVEFIEYLKNI